MESKPKWNTPKVGVPFASNPEMDERNKVEIDFFEPSDMDAVFELRLAGRKTDPHIFITSYEKEAAKSPEERRKWFEGTTGPNPPRIIVLAKSNHLPIGMIGAREQEKGVWSLHGVYVRPEFRGKHVASDMMHAIITKIRERQDAKTMTFQAEAENLPALGMYKKFGFEIVGTDKETMGDSVEHNKYVLKQDIGRIQS